MATRNLGGKRRLGRGLDSLIPASAPVSTDAPPTRLASASDRGPSDAPASREYFLCALESIRPMHGQPRKTFEPDALEALAQSITESGIIQPLVVRELSDGMFGLVAGERRWRASQLAGLTKVPVVVRDFSDQDAFAAALIENVQREDLNPVEEAEAFQHLIDTFSLTQQSAAQRVGKSRAAVANGLRLLKLPQSVRDLLADGTISPGHARAVLSVDPALHGSFADEIATKGLSVRAAEDRAKVLREPVPEPEPETAEEAARRRTSANEYNAQIKDVEDRLQKRLSAGVRIKRKKDNSGTIEIAFTDTEALNALLDEFLT